MEAILFCSRCRGMRVGWNVRYIYHRLVCKEWVPNSSKLLIITVLIAITFFAFPTPGAFVFSVNGPNQAFPEVQGLAPEVGDPAVASIEAFLEGYGVSQSHRGRVAESIVNSAKKHNLDPRLVASIVIVESRANPFAISSKDAVGIMQVHLPTWGPVADREGINLFRIEDNVEFGTRILRDYVRQSGVWEGVKRYKGWFANNPQSESSVMEYLAKVQRIYGFHEPIASTAELLQ